MSWIARSHAGYLCKSHMPHGAVIGKSVLSSWMRTLLANFELQLHPFAAEDIKRGCVWTELLCRFDLPADAGWWRQALDRNTE